MSGAEPVAARPRPVRAVRPWRAARRRSIFRGMQAHAHDPAESPDAAPHFAGTGPVRVARTEAGALTYLLDGPPEALPAVRGHDLDRAWHAARGAAIGQRWDSARGIRFHRPDGGTTDLALADPDACCWAGAVDRLAGLGTWYGMALCLRLLALVDLLGRAPWTAALCRLARDGAEIDPRLLRVAASLPLTAEARLDEALVRARLGVPGPPALAHGGRA